VDFPDTVPSAELAGEAMCQSMCESFPHRGAARRALVMLFIFLAAIPALMLLFVPYTGFPGWRVTSLAGLLWFVWLLGRQLVGGRPALRVGPEGISAAILKNRTIAWSEVADIASQTVQGNTSITVSLAPHTKDKWWWGSRKKNASPFH
jgi:hypothetical protein